MSCKGGYQQSQVGPWGYTLNGQVQRTAELNTPFDQLSWENALLDGCQPAPCREYPTFPPPPGTGFIYPSLSKVTQSKLLGEDRGPGTSSAPYIETAVPNPNEDLTGLETTQYSPEEILNSSPSCNIQPFNPSALPGSRWNPTPLEHQSKQPMYVREIEGNWIPQGQTHPNMYDPLKQSCVNPQLNQTNRNGSVCSQNLPTLPQLEYFSQRNSQGRPTTATTSKSLANAITSSPTNNDDDDDDGETLIIGINKKGYDRIAMTDPVCLRYNLRHLFPCMINAFRGIMYDFAFWDDLPCRRNKFIWILTREDRIYYIATFVFILCLLYALLRIICSSLGITSQVNNAIVIALVVFILYFMTPPPSEENQLAKAISVSLVVVMLFIIYYYIQTFKNTNAIQQTNYIQ